MTAARDRIRALPARYGKTTLILLAAIVVVGLGARAYVVVNPVSEPADDSRAYYALAKALYEDVYCRRGTAENHIKSWKTHLAADRTSCTSATANQFRLFLHAGAYWLMWGLRAAMPKRVSPISSAACRSTMPTAVPPDAARRPI